LSDKQQELFEATTTWFHVFKSMVDNGDMAKLSGSSVKVYLVVKSYTNFATGRAFPAQETICEAAGLSKAQVKRCLAELEEYGYINKEKKGRNNLYTLREKVDIRDEEGSQYAVATWDYLPSTVSNAVADLKKVLVTGDFEGAKIVNIERLQVNVNNAYDNSHVVNAQTANYANGGISYEEFEASLEGLPAKNKASILETFKRNREKLNQSGAK